MYASKAKSGTHLERVRHSAREPCLVCGVHNPRRDMPVGEVQLLSCCFTPVVSFENNPRRCRSRSGLDTNLNLTGQEGTQNHARNCKGPTLVFLAGNVLQDSEAWSWLKWMFPKTGNYSDSIGLPPMDSTVEAMVTIRASSHLPNQLLIHAKLNIPRCILITRVPSN